MAQPASSLDEVLEGRSPLGALGAAAKGNAERRKDGALPACTVAEKRKKMH